MKYLYVALLLWPFSTWAAADSLEPQDDLSAAFIIDACKEKHGVSSYLKDLCSGEIQALISLTFSGPEYFGDDGRFCPPNDIKIEQAKKVVIKYIDDRPESSRMSFMILALDGLRKAWPCPKR
jgi:hypothetical protein